MKKKRKRSLGANWPIAAGAYPGLCSMKRLRSISSSPERDASPSQVTPPQFVRFPPTIRRYPFIHLGGESLGAVRVKCLAQEHNTMSSARARTGTARSGVERTNHETTAPPTWCHVWLQKWLSSEWSNAHRIPCHMESTLLKKWLRGYADP